MFVALDVHGDSVLSCFGDAVHCIPPTCSLIIITRNYLCSIVFPLDAVLLDLFVFLCVFFFFGGGERYIPVNFFSHVGAGLLVGTSSKQSATQCLRRGSNLDAVGWLVICECGFT